MILTSEYLVWPVRKSSTSQNIGLARDAINIDVWLDEYLWGYNKSYYWTKNNKKRFVSKSVSSNNCNIALIISYIFQLCTFTCFHLLVLGWWSTWCYWLSWSNWCAWKIFERRASGGIRISRTHVLKTEV